MDSVTVSADITAQSGCDLKAEIMALLTVTGPGGEKFKAGEKLLYLMEGEPHFATPSIEIPHPQIWWPNGYGSQPLYEVEITLKDGKKLLDQRTYQIGLRTLELRQEPDPWGKEFTFYVNGVPAVCQGR